MANGGLNVEIGNPSYNMYEVDHDNHAVAGNLLHPNFTLDPHKVRLLSLIQSSPVWSKTAALNRGLVSHICVSDQWLSRDSVVVKGPV